ncbi:type I methionyl aminopeptidase [Desulfobaculum bizertense]|uniref:Methionine aminopeptidase n=1 Tax=Desulfobaculum bizertense DSM 18034 TaxID=1121442 RepID=A0A1T4W219_9BACT|nr:type I methionyl aminopeptidase [Desulfobaculum bizertense]SKA71296.1 methionine aminopeptidase, type I [Desulfobaculum bizertense DSM 18034]
MNFKKKAEIELMRKAGVLLWQAHQLAGEMAEAGTTTEAIDAEVEKFIIGHNATPLFKGVPGEVPFPATCCISVNEEVVHGIPSARELANGDIVSFDIGLKLNGWCADCACTHAVGDIDDEKRQLMDVTEECLHIAIKEIHPNIKWSKIAKKMAKHARNAGFSVVETLVGHGIGKEMWELPQVPNYFSRGCTDFRLKQGMVIAVEPMINVGTKEVETLSDHWTIVTKDRKPACHFEHTIAVTASGAKVMTCGPNGEAWAMK